MKRRKPLSRKALQALLCQKNDQKNLNPASATQEEILANWRGFFF
jgi:hypothetical protein